MIFILLLVGVQSVCADNFGTFSIKSDLTTYSNEVNSLYGLTNTAVDLTVWGPETTKSPYLTSSSTVLVSSSPSTTTTTTPTTTTSPSKITPASHSPLPTSPTLTITSFPLSVDCLDITKWVTSVSTEDVYATRFVTEYDTFTSLKYANLSTLSMTSEPTRQITRDASIPCGMSEKTVTVTSVLTATSVKVIHQSSEYPVKEPMTSSEFDSTTSTPTVPLSIRQSYVSNLETGGGSYNSSVGSGERNATINLTTPISNATVSKNEIFTIPGIDLPITIPDLLGTESTGVAASILASAESVATASTQSLITSQVLTPTKTMAASESKPAATVATTTKTSNAETNEFQCDTFGNSINTLLCVRNATSRVTPPVYPLVLLVFAVIVFSI